MSYTVNDNVYSPTKTSYVADIGLVEGFTDLGWNPGHDLQDLVGFDHLEIFMRCGVGASAWTYSWIQDLVYDANANIPELPNPDYDWRSDQFGPDGSIVVSSDPTNHPVPPSGIVLASHSSLEYNLENSSWILVNEAGQSTNYNDWMSPDLSPKGTISVTIPPTDVNAISGIHEDYPFYVSTGATSTDLYEWAIVYEMALDLTACGSEEVSFGVTSAFNSPSKDGNEDVEIPVTEINGGGSIDLRVSKDDGGVSVAAGDTIQYTILFTNTGQAVASGVVLTETVPANSTFNNSESTAGWSCSSIVAGSTCTYSIGVVTGLGGGGQVLFAVDVVNSLPVTVTEVFNTVEIGDDGASGLDQKPDDNMANDTTPIIVSQQITPKLFLPAILDSKE